MQQRKNILIIVLITLIFLTGCWSRKEINELAITSALGFDYVDDQYVISTEILNPGDG